MSIKIMLTRGIECEIDEIDQDLSQYIWCAANVNARKPDVYYAMRAIYKPKHKSIYMAREILERMIGRELIRGEIVDHINGDTLDNRRCNLRLSTKTENNRNCGKRRDKTSCEYKGVTWHKRKDKWQASIRVNHQLKFLGYFDDKILAAKAYDVAAKEYFKEFANLNFPE